MTTCDTWIHSRVISIYNISWITSCRWIFFLIFFFSFGNDISLSSCSREGLSHLQKYTRGLRKWENICISCVALNGKVCTNYACEWYTAIYIFIWYECIRLIRFSSSRLIFKARGMNVRWLDTPGFISMSLKLANRGRSNGLRGGKRKTNDNVTVQLMWITRVSRKTFINQ